MRSAFILSALAVIVPALGAPTFVPITKRAGPVKEHSYIIKLKEGSSMTESYDALTKIFSEHSPESSVTYNYDVLFHGFAIDLRDNGPMPFIQQMSSIEHIEPDHMMSIDYESGIDGLAPVPGPIDGAVGSSMGKRGSQGADVTVYGLDTGIYTEHNCFENRARWGKAFGGYKERDGHGHGTHTAGTAVGKGFGVATAADIVSVKVMSDEGSGSTTDIMAGIEYAFSDCKDKNRCIVTMSLGGAPNQSLDDTVEKAIDGGLHFTIAAGNSNVPAETSSPARVKRANTIGAVDSNNQKASFSNYGELIDVWAPGVAIESAWIDGPDSKRTASGTSMATPYVAGVLAVALGSKPMDPATASKELQAHAQHEVTFAPADVVAKTTSTDLRAYPW